jgi:regulator of sirC expression with transglutaminase-like and TPR domain
MNLNRFDMLMELPDDVIRLDCASLQLARDVYPDLNLLFYLERLDQLAEELQDSRAGLSAIQRYEAMRDLLVERHGFQGNDDDFYDPQNSYLNCVLERSVGNPINLSVLWIEVARRLNWPVFGVGFPGHFMVRFDDPDRFLVADPFSGGQAVSTEDCQQMLDRQFAGKVKFDPQMLEPVSVRAILARSLNNLRGIYRANQDWQRLDDVLQRLAAVDPSNEDHRMELVAIRYRLGDLRSAYAHLSTYLNYRPDSEEREGMAQKLNHLGAMIAALN